MATTKVQRIMTQPIVLSIPSLPNHIYVFVYCVRSSVGALLLLVKLCSLLPSLIPDFWFFGLMRGRWLQNLIFRFLQSVSQLGRVTLLLILSQILLV